MQRIKILSDYTSADDPNVLTMILDDQGDYHISIFEDDKNNGLGIRIANSGSRYSPRVREALRNFLKVYQEELMDTFCKPEIREINDM